MTARDDKSYAGELHNRLINWLYGDQTLKLPMVEEVNSLFIPSHVAHSAAEQLIPNGETRTIALGGQHAVGAVNPMTGRGVATGAAACVPSTTPQKPRGTYVPLTEEQIDGIRPLWANALGGDQRFNVLCDMAINCLLYAQEIHRLRDTPVSAIRRSREEAYRRAFVLLLAEVMASGWFHADPSMKAKVVAYLHTANLDNEHFTVEKVLHDAMGIPTDAERAFIANNSPDGGKASNGG